MIAWLHGIRSRLAADTGITPGTLSDIIRARKPASLELAERIAAAAIQLGYYLSVEDLRDPVNSNNPLILGGKYWSEEDVS